MSCLQGACALFYFFCNWFTKSFILHFVVETVLIVVDFWFTKNIGGRRLVGMRWWHIPSQEGSTTWRFEHKGLEDVRSSSTKQLEQHYERLLLRFQATHC